jgi:hypothetical protein
MRRQMKTLLPFVLVSMLLCMCESPPPVQEEPQKQPEEVPKKPETEVERETETKTEPERKPEEEFVVSEEVYTKTFDEIEEFIRNLNEIIRNEDYDTWLTYLSEAYIERTSDPAYLKEQSEKPLLKKSNIELDDLKDYFEYVVVPSRTQAQLDEIEFVDEKHVKAYAKIGDTKALLYLLVRDDDKWKIGVR